MAVEPAKRPRQADFVRFLWRALVAAVVVYVIAGILLILTDEANVFNGGSGFFTFVNDASGIAFRVGVGSLALMAGLALSSRDYDG